MENHDIYSALLGLPSLTITDTSLSKNKLDIYCETSTSSCKCTICKQSTTAIHQRTTRTLRDLNMGIRQVYLHVTSRQFYCASCHHYFHEDLDFAEPNKSFTIRQTDFMFLISQHQSYQSTGAILDINAKTVERTVLAKCEQLIDLPKNYAQVRRLGIDEQSNAKGKQDYMCILTDLDRGTIVDLLPDRKKETLVAHFKKLGSAFCAQITDVSCDCWETYINVAIECFPNAEVTLDRFHFTKHLNEGIGAYLREIKPVLKPLLSNKKDFSKLQKLINKQYHTLTDIQLDKLDAAFEKEPKLKEIYFHREAFHHILDNNTDPTIASKQIDAWITDTKKIEGGTCFEKFVNSLNSTKKYIANYVKNKLSNAVTEGLNNIIRVIKRFSFGMPNFKNLRLRSLAFFL
jgi:transposase